jgi:transglutaminase-like putative cysteine protease
VTACCSNFLAGWQSERTRAPNTLKKMREFVTAAVRDPEFVYFARRLVAGVMPRDEKGIAAAIRGYLTRNFHFVQDPHHVEDVRDPRYMVAKINTEGKFLGDCDDAAVLAAALGKAVGLPARFVAVAFAKDGPYKHVLALLYPMDKPSMARVPVEMDITRPLGYTPPAVARELVVNV